ncbi:DUF397 domain-containing protein [Kitasatospora sp. NPDC093806]|uniref:DUF397 domain-containing protein n=1 Tax=Kitasatospora sp. NPDC093806 TaxID=3155075 RepID=UPI00341FE1AA
MNDSNLTWQKSSYSDNDGGHCIEVAESVHGAPACAWHKSSYSGGNGGQCVETAESAVGRLVRDSKDPEGPVLSFRAPAWRSFLLAIRADEFPNH